MSVSIPSSSIPSSSISDVVVSGATSAIYATPEQRSKPILKVRWIELEDLPAIETGWEQLAQHAVWVNPSYEPNYLIPALKHFGNDSIGVLIVEDVSSGNSGEIVGLLPVETKRIYRLPFKTAQAWKHDQCFDATPLLHSGCAAEVWKAMCERLVEDGYKLLSLETVSAEAAVDQTFRRTEQENQLVRFQRDKYQRAALKPASSLEQYTEEFVSKSIRKKSAQAFKRLEKIGEVKFELVTHEGDFNQLTEDFLRIESSGWKGKQGTALACAPSTEAFYRELVQRSAAAGKIRFLSLKLDGKRIGMISDLHSGNVVYSYKSGYDEAFAKYSPGRQVELKNVEFLHQAGIDYSDSCTSPSNDMMNKMWGQKIAFQNMIISLCPGAARVALQAFPLLQSAVRQLRQRKK